MFSDFPFHFSQLTEFLVVRDVSTYAKSFCLIFLLALISVWTDSVCFLTVVVSCVRCCAWQDRYRVLSLACYSYHVHGHLCLTIATFGYISLALYNASISIANNLFSPSRFFLLLEMNSKVSMVDCFACML